MNSLKIDRAFVADLKWGSDEAALVGAIVRFGQSLGKGVIAEGIETPEQMEQLCRTAVPPGKGSICHVRSRRR